MIINNFSQLPSVGEGTSCRRSATLFTRYVSDALLNVALVSCDIAFMLHGQLLCEDRRRCVRVHTTDLYKYSIPDAVPPIHGESYHVATDKGPSIDSGKCRSIFSDNLQPIASRGKKARGTLLVDKHCCNGCSIKRAPLSVSYYNEISGGHIWRTVVRRRVSAGPVLPLWYIHSEAVVSGQLEMREDRD